MTANAPVAARRREHGPAPAQSTSIRVSVDTRDAILQAARAEGLSITRYLDELMRRTQRERLFAEFRADLIEACQDEAFVVELQEWDDLDDGVRLDRPDAADE